MTAKFTYEQRPCIEEPDGITECPEPEADLWGVYERRVEPDAMGFRPGMWIADFARKEDALAFKQLMEKNA